MPLLYSYTIPVDDGAAPNPFGGICTLAICKPAIRRTANVGDWIVGLGSKNAPSGDLTEKVVYAMRVSQKISLDEYDRRAAEEWPSKIPNVKAKSLPERLGDCIYYKNQDGEICQRPSVHGPDNMATDLSGENVLISDTFYYWGRQPVVLPQELIGICHQTQGHKCHANTAYFKIFTDWIKSLGFDVGKHGEPDYEVDWQSSGCSGCSIRREASESDSVDV